MIFLVSSVNCSDLEDNNMKFLIIFSSILSAVVAQQIRCDYIFNIVYMCQLTISNPTGFNNFTGIPGTHLPGYTDNDVELVQTVSGSTTIVPTIICTKFPNTGYIIMSGSGLTQIGDTAFNNCFNLKEISLAMNSISSISSNAFNNNPNVEYIALSVNNLATLPETVFASQRNLLALYLSNNPFTNIPAGLFRPLESVLFINLDNTRITAINNQWFAQNANLDQLSLSYNSIVLNANSFVGLDGLDGLYITNNAITDIPVGTFDPLRSLEYLSFSNNRVSQFHPNTFNGLGNLKSLDFSGNPLVTIPNGTFRALTNLFELDLTFCGLTSLNSNSFEGLGRLQEITLSTNQIQVLPSGLFAQSPDLSALSILNNRLTEIRRATFGRLTYMYKIGVEGNQVRAIDRAVIEDSMNLNFLYMNGNVCANYFFHTFQQNKAQYMTMLQTCFNNAL